MSAQKNKSDAPDFAYPQQVIKDADKMLDSALKSGDGVTVVKALVQSGLAQTSISPDSLPAVISRIESVNAKEKDGVTHALLDLLLAEIYKQYYGADTYNLNQRPALANPGTDITLWSGKEFKDKIIDLYDDAFRYSDALKKARIADYKPVIACDKGAEIFYPTLFDFASARAVAGISDLDAGRNKVLSELYFFDFVLRLPNVLSRPSKEAIEIANRWVLANEGAPRVAALLARYRLVDDYVVEDDEDDDGNETLETPLFRLYEENRNTPYAVEFLLAENYYSPSVPQKRLYYNALKSFEKEHGEYFRINAVKNAIAELSLPSCGLSFPSQVARGKEFTVDVRMTNLPSTDVMIYRVKDQEVDINTNNYRLSSCRSTPVARVTVTADDEVPFSETKKATFKLDDYGVYVITTPLQTDKREWLTAIYCSDMAMMDTRTADKLRVYTVSGVDGAPVDGATVTTYNNNGNKPSKLRTRTTGSDGAVDINPGDLRNILIQATKGADRFGDALGEYLSRYRPEDEITTAFTRTALAIYHPGDTLDFVSVFYKYKGSTRSVVKNTDFKAVLRNTNFVAVDTIDIRTDDFGRAAASFAIPEEGLTGKYSIQLFDKSLERLLAGDQVMVSDYKLPTYEAMVDSVTVNDADGSVTVSGKAMTYSGFPVQNASVEATLSGLQRVWWRRDAVQFHTDTLMTDADGCFRWTIAKETLAESPFAGGRYQVEFTVTSPSGENRTCQDSFSLSKEASITIEESGWIAAAKDTDCRITVNNPLGKPVDATLRLKLRNEADGKVYEIEAQSRGGRTTADFSQLHSGEYELTAEAVGIEAKSAEADVTIYNAADNNCPADVTLWVPERALTAPAGSRKAEIVYGTAIDNANVLMTVYSGKDIISEQWLKPVKGMNRVEVTVPQDYADISVRMSIVNDFKLRSEDMKVTVENPDAKLKVKVEHLRDRLTPLAGEQVTVKVTNAAGSGMGAAVILDMYSKALDNLASQSWVFYPASGYTSGAYFGNNILGSRSDSFRAALKNLKVEALSSAPEFNFYGMTWGGYGRYDGAMLYGNRMIRGSRPMMMKMSSGVDDLNVVREHKAEVVVEEIADCSLSECVTVGSAAGIAVEEEVAEDGGAPAKEKAAEQYRPSEVPLAFFAPMLSADAEGNVTYSFTVPNANTTWVLNALAYTDKLATDLDVREVISSKPVMVEPNMPRFLRTGDVAEVLATVMNATDESSAVVTTFEVIDPVDGSVIDTQTVDSEIAPRQSATVKFNIAAPATAGALMVRVKSSTESYSDGVQTLLPVLESSQPVIESSTFYLTPEQKEFTRELPGEKKDTQVTLSFCENPTWEVVSALPGLRSDDAQTSLAASAQIFAAAVSGYVMQLNPAIEPALKEWLASAKDAGEMLSMLNRNEELKQLVLAATPWVQQAQSDEERMTRLSMLFDRKEIDRSISAGIKLLQKMQRDNGGWSWTLNYDHPSEWVIMQILNNFAELRQLGCYPAQLDGMVRKALGYIDAETAKAYSKYPDSDYSYYTYVRSLYRDVPMSTGAQRAYNASVQKTLKNWKKSRTVAKAADALVLYRNDYKAVAGEILNSVREFATSTPESGMWWPSVDRSSWWSMTTVGQTAFILQAFNTIEPGCAEIDPIRQWLILNKITQDWGNSVDASACVAAILQCGSSWLNRPGDAVVTIDGNKLVADRMDKLTGQIVAKIDDAKGELKITRTVDGPAWGAVIEQSTQVMKDVKAHSIPELSISKEMFVKTGNGWAPADSFTVGQVVKVRLVMKALRDMDYVAVVDNRAATFEPVVQTPRPVYCDGLVFYLENRDAATNLFIDHLPAGQYVIEYEMNVNNAGRYASGLATIQSQYAPEMTAHSAGLSLRVE